MSTNNRYVIHVERNSDTAHHPFSVMVSDGKQPVFDESGKKLSALLKLAAAAIMQIEEAQ